MTRRVLCCVLSTLAILALGSPLYAAQTVHHQGRLLDNADQPVADGFYLATFSLWDDPVAGNQVWSETRDIQTRNGLFSVELGAVSSFFDIFTELSSHDLYLQTQVQVSGSVETLSPRLRIGTVPMASVSKRVHGVHNGLVSSSTCDVSATDSGAVSVLVHDSDGDGLADRRVSEDCDDTDASVTLEGRAPGGGGGAGGLLYLSASDVSSSSSMSVDLDGDGVPDRSIDQDCDDVSASFRMRHKPEVLFQAWDDGVELRVDDVASSSLVVRDLDADGVADLAVSSVCDASSARHAIKTKGTGADANRTAEVSSSTTPSSASSVCSLDLDGDGVLDRRHYEECDDQNVSSSMSFFDVFTESSIDDDCDGIGAERRLRSYGIGSSGQDGVEVTLRCSPDSAVQSTELRRAGAVVCADFGRHTPFHNKRTMSFFDVFTEATVDQDCDATGARLAINTKGTSAKRTAACSTDASSSSVVASGDDDGDGLDDSEAALRITPSTSSLAIKTKGTSAQRLSTGRDCDDQDITDYLDFDDDGDGLAESFSRQLCTADSVVREVSLEFTSSLLMPALMKAKEKANRTKCSSNLRYQSPVASNEAELAVDSAGSALTMTADTDGDGLADRVIREQCDDDDASITVARGSSEIKIRHKGWDGTIKGRMAIENSGAIQVDFGGDGVGFVSERFGVGVLSPTHPVEHSSGAHLTAGGVWTNASDENLKENFQPVDGEEILEKLENLEISQWNYKNESDEVTHIGPTAQDFKATFGVGSNDKSISTIDPSGIALVAVKELRKENQELKAQVEELKKMVEELARKK